MNFWDRVGAGASEVIEAGGDVIEGIGLSARARGEQYLANAQAQMAAVDIAIMKANNREQRLDQLLDITKYIVFAILLIAVLNVIYKNRK